VKILKREYFGGLFLIISVVLVLTVGYFFGDEVVADKLHKTVVVWLLLAYLLGQYSTKFPKAF